ncbi:ribonuclease H-like domain-containing protein [Tanacetum coccineum]
MTHPHPNRRFVPQAVLTMSGKINTVGASVNTAVRPVNTAGSKTTVNHPKPILNVYKKGYSHVTRPFNKNSANKNSVFNKKGNPQQKEYKEKGVIDSRCSRHMTGNKCYLTEYEDYDGGFVSFRDGKGRIYGKDRMERAATTASSLEAEQDIEAQSRFKAASKQSNDPPLSRVNTLGSGEDIMKLMELMEHCTTLSELICYALTVNPTIYTSCIEQFWATAKVKTINGERQLQALVDKKKVIITETNIRSDLHLKQVDILIPFYITDPLISPGPKDSEEDVGMKPTEVNESGASDKGEADEQDTRINAAKTSEEHLFEQFYPFKNAFTLLDVPNVSPMDDNTRIFAGAYDDEDLGDSSPGRSKLDRSNARGVLQFELQKVWTLVDLPNGMRANGTKWVSKTRKMREELLLETRQDWLHKMDVKSAFLYGTIEEEVYVCQPPGFEDLHFPDKVYKVEKALYGLHQAPKAWYETLSTYLIENGFRRAQ